MPLIFVRSLIFNVLFYALMVVWIVVILPSFILPRRVMIAIAKAWALHNLWLMRLVCGTRVEFRHAERIPKGPLIVASKHQSMWETFALVRLLDDPLYILKRELLWIPFFGWYLKKAGMIGIDRTAGGRALLNMMRRARDQVRNGRQLVIFPEGTRRPVDAPPEYKPGVGQMYVQFGVPCVPVALNSGLFWPRRTFMRYPGTIVVECLEVVPPGLSRDAFLGRIEQAIEAATARIVAEARAEQAKLFKRDG